MLRSLRRAGRLLGALLTAAVAPGCNQSPYCPASACPATMPAVGSPCSGFSPVGGCEYGDDPWHACNTILVCYGGPAWSLKPSDGSCPGLVPAECPATLADARAVSMCSSGQTDHPTCRYPDGVCNCTTGPAFTCSPPPGAGCPATRPRSGTPCSGSCPTWGTGQCDGESMVCGCGVWQLAECTE